MTDLRPVPTIAIVAVVPPSCRRAYLYFVASCRCQAIMASSSGLGFSIEIHQDVRAELSMEQDEGWRSVEITVRQGVVYLTGFVESYAVKRAIHRIVGQIPGVKGMRDYLHVRPSLA